MKSANKTWELLTYAGRALVFWSVIFTVFFLSSTVWAATFTVNDAGDASDNNIGNGACATAGAVCTLRAAVEEANGAAGADTIQFSVSGTITIATTLSLTTNGSVTVDGGANHDVLVNGPGTATHDCFTVNTASNVIKGLVLQDCRYGVYFNNAAATGNKIQNNYIGTTNTGNAISSSAVSRGVFLNAGASNIIGTDGDGSNDASEGNVITSGTSNAYGVYVSTASNFIAGNMIGVGADGSSDLGTGAAGIYVNSVANNIIGTNGDGTGDLSERNVISGWNDDSSSYGIYMTGAGSTGNRIAGNYIGTTTDGTAALTNRYGVYLANSVAGNIIGTNGDGLGDAGERNVISGSTTAEVYLWTATDSNRVSGNYIGLNAAGTAALNGGGDGISITGTNNIVGTNADGTSDELERNIISGHTGNNQSGIDMAGTGNKVKGNYIGTSADGLSALPNYWGIDWKTSTGVIGTDGDGTNDAIEGNVISGSVQMGIFAQGLSVTSAVRISGNYIGVDATGNAALPNGTGISMSSNAPSVPLIGTDGDGTSDTFERNIISGNTGIGVNVPAPGGVIAGNYIGIGSDGSSDLGNGTHGIYINNTTNSVIGGDVVAEENIIRFNGDAAGEYGIYIAGASAANNRIQGNSVYDNQTDWNVAINATAAPTLATGGTLGSTTVTITQAAGQSVYVFKDTDGDATCEPVIYLGVATDNADGTYSYTANGLNIYDKIIVTAFQDSSYNTSLLSSCQVPSAVTSICVDDTDASTANGIDCAATCDGSNDCGLNDALSVGLGSSATISFGGSGIGTHNITSTLTLAGSGGLTIDAGADHDVVVNGPGTATTDCLTVTSPNNVIKGLVLQDCRYGVYVNHASASGNKIQNNYIGTTSTGNAISSSAVSRGIYLNVGDSNIIGADGDGSGDSSEGNVITSGTANAYAVYIATASNTVAGNKVGVGADGTTDLGIGSTGIYVTGANNVIGTDGDGIGDADERNIVSGWNEDTTSYGIILTSASATGNTIAGNYIGVLADGNTAAANRYGIQLATNAASNNIGTNGDGTSDALERNIISGNTTAGIYFTGTGANHLIKGNYIGIGADGSTPLSNGIGINLQSSSGSVIIGTDGSGPNDAAERNVISGNSSGAGIQFSAGIGSVVAGNYIGISADGSSAVANSDGVYIGVTSVRIGTNSDGTSDDLERNVISGNTTEGLLLSTTSTGTVQGNYIGTNPAGTAALPNVTGIALAATGAWTIGTNGDGSNDAGEVNIVSGNSGTGISVTGTAAHIIAGNLVGTDPAGTGDLGNGIHGIHVNNIDNVTIGGDVSAEENLIRFNGDAASEYGVNISGASANNNQILGNKVYDNQTDWNVANNATATPTLTTGGTLASTTVTITQPAGQTVYVYNDTDGDGTCEPVDFLGTATDNADGTYSYTASNLAIYEKLVVTAFQSSSYNTSQLSACETPSGVTAVCIDDTDESSNNAVNCAETCDGSDDCSLADASSIISGDNITVSFGGNGAGTHDMTSTITIGAGTTIDGGSNHDVRIDGTGTAGIDCLMIGGNNTTIKGLVITNCKYGIVNSGEYTGATLQGNYIGLSTDGSTTVANSYGVYFNSAATGSLIGTNGDGSNDTAERNIISGNTSDGIYTSSTSAGKIKGNYIGLDDAGTTAKANGSYGVELAGTGAWIVGTEGDGTGDASEGNYISGNTSRGITITSTGAHVIAGNTIGLDTGGTARSNSYGINIVATGTLYRVGTNGDGISDTYERNIISGNATYGVIVGSSSQGTIAGNYIGLNAVGTAAVANGIGVDLAGTSVWTVGTNGDGTGDAVEGNYITGNSTYGIWIPSNSGHVIAGNIIGLDTTGTAMSNGIGIYTSGAGTGQRIGTNSDGTSDTNERNIISGNTTGISTSSSSAGKIWGNYIGTDAAGTVAKANTTGITLASTGAWTVGTNGDSTRDSTESNVVSGNSGTGISISGSAAHVIAGNYVGPASNGSADLGNGTHGVYVNDIDNVIIGGDLLAEENLIRFNGNAASEYGVYIAGASANNNQIQRNTVYDNQTDWYVANNATSTPMIATSGTLGATIVTVTQAAGQTVHIYKDSDGDTTCEGATYLGAATDNGNGTYTYAAGTLNIYDKVTAAAFQSSSYNTSNLGSCAIPQISDICVDDTDEASTDATDCSAACDSSNDCGLSDAFAIIGDMDEITVTFDDNAAGTHHIVSTLLLSSDGNTIDAGDDHEVIVDGTGTAGIDCFDISGSNNTLKGFVIGNCNKAVAVTGATATGNKIQNNYIGTDATGLASLANNYGVHVTGLNNNLIGTDGDGTDDSSEGNVIAASVLSGVYLAGDDNTVAGNKIGTGINGTTDLGNGENGIYVDDAADNSIGGDLSIEANTIRYNGDLAGDYGIYIAGASALGNQIYRNAIYDNQSEISVEDNPSTSASVQAIADGGSVANLALSFLSTVGYAVDVYADTDGDAVCEAQTYLGQATDVGAGTFAMTNTTLTVGSKVALIARDGTNNSSNLSVCRTVTDLTPVLSAVGNKSGDEESTLSFALASYDANPGDAATLYSCTNANAAATTANICQYLNSLTGIFNWAMSLTREGIYQIVVAAVDASDVALLDSEAITITVNGSDDDNGEGSEEDDDDEGGDDVRSGDGSEYDSEYGIQDVEQSSVSGIRISGLVTGECGGVVTAQNDADDRQYVSVHDSSIFIDGNVNVIGSCSRPVISNPSLGSVVIFTESVDDVGEAIELDVSSAAAVPMQLSNLSQTRMLVNAATASNGYVVLRGNSDADQFGSYTAVGDVDHDGEDDVLIAAPGSGTHGLLYIYGADAVVKSIIFGSAANPIGSVISVGGNSGNQILLGPDNPAMNSNLIRPDEKESSDGGYMLLGGAGIEGLLDLADSGVDVSLGAGSYETIASGDVNGDGFPDIALATEDGRILVYFGPFAALNVRDESMADVVVTGSGGEFGTMLVIGDANGDELADIIIGAPQEGTNSQGAIYIVWGRESWNAEIDTDSATGVRVFSGSEVDAQIGEDILLVPGTTTTQLYTVEGETGALLFTITHGSDEGGSSEGSVGVVNGGGCSIYKHASHTNFLAVLIVALACIWGVRQSSKRLR